VFFTPEGKDKPLEMPLPAAAKCLDRLGLGADSC
jgi:hypothetical protein